MAEHHSAFVQRFSMLAPPTRDNSVKTNVTIIMDEPVSTDDKAVLGKLNGAGLTVDQVLPRIAVVTGSIDRAKLSSLRALPEVKVVEESGVVRLID